MCHLLLAVEMPAASGKVLWHLVLVAGLQPLLLVVEPWLLAAVVELPAVVLLVVELPAMPVEAVSPDFVQPVGLPLAAVPLGRLERLRSAGQQASPDEKNVYRVC